MKVGIIHPGAMGSTIAAAVALNCSEVWVALERRSEATRARAAGTELRDAGTLDALVDRCDLIISVCPPANALELARSVAALEFSGIYADANAVSPETARRIGSVIGEAAEFVDAGIIGPPATRAGTTRLYLSGARAHDVASCFESGPLDALVIEGPPGSASALKMAYAAWTKGTAAMLAGIYAVAVAEGVESDLLREWGKSIPDLPARLKGTAAGIAPKAWRFEGEMREIAETFRGAGIPPGFFEAAAEVYGRLAGFKNSEPPTPEQVAARLLEPPRAD